MRVTGKLVVSIIVIMVAALVMLGGCSNDEAKQTDQSSASNTDATGKPQLLYFTGKGCPACDVAKPVVNELEKEMSGKVVFKKLEYAGNEELFSKYNIQFIPTVVILDGSGKEVYTKTGVEEDAGKYKEELERELERVALLPGVWVAGPMNGSPYL